MRVARQPSLLAASPITATWFRIAIITTTHTSAARMKCVRVLQPVPTSRPIDNILRPIAPTHLEVGAGLAGLVARASATGLPMLEGMPGLVVVPPEPMPDGAARVVLVVGGRHGERQAMLVE